MHALTEFLFPAPAKRKASAIFGWWEKRRLPYNLMVGGSGLLSIAIGNVLALLPPGSELFAMIPPWQPIVVFGVLANVFYLLGPLVEITIDKIWGREILPTGPVLYRMGLTFSLGLTMIPVLMSLVFWVARIVMAVF